MAGKHTRAGSIYGILVSGDGRLAVGIENIPLCT